MENHLGPTNYKTPIKDDSKETIKWDFLSQKVQKLKYTSSPSPPSMIGSSANSSLPMMGSLFSRLEQTWGYGAKPQISTDPHIQRVPLAWMQ